MTARCSRRQLAPVSRRALLRGLAVGALAPLVPRLRARADTGPRRPQNLVLLFHPNGLEPGWQPVDAGEGFRLVGSTLAALDRHREDLLVLDGIRGGIANEILAHTQGMTSLWTGARIPADDAFAGHPSIDRLIAARLGGATPFRTLDLGVQTSSGGRLENTTTMLYDGPERPVEPEDDPNAVYDRVFGAAVGDPAELGRARRARASVFDLVRDQLRKLERSYGAEDRVRIERHHQHVSDLEARLRALDERVCANDFARHDFGARAVASDDRLFPDVVALQTDLLVAALACGLTRVASIQLSDSVSNTRIPGVNERAGVHGVMHTGTRTEKTRINQWFVGQVAALLDRLREVEFEDGTTLLDDTLVVWGSEMAVGNHLNDPIPFVLAGGGRDGVFRLGRRVRFEDAPRHTRLLVSVLHAFGLEDVTRVGDFDGPDDVGPLPQLRRGAS